jgi:hypothetical protein
LDYARLYTLHRAGSFFVPSAGSNLDARRLFSAPIDRSSGVICDQIILLNGYPAMVITPTICVVFASGMPTAAKL